MRTALYPLIWILQLIYLSISRVTGSYGFALLLLSLVTGVIMAWLGSLIKHYPEREALVQSLMAPKLRQIKTESSAEARHKRTVELYHRYNYHPILALRSAFPLFLQLPFLFAAYHMLSHLAVLQGVSFWVIKDLASPDGLLAGINLLPIAMTIINIATALITPGFTKRDTTQAIMIAGIFLLFLYNAPSALLVFWTTNNLLFLARTLKTRKGYRATKSAVIERKYGLSITQHVVAYTPILKQWFALLCLFYLYQAIALVKGYHFPSYLKYVPFLIASAGFFALQLVELTRGFRTSLRSIVAASLVGSLIVVTLIGLSFSLVSGTLPGIGISKGLNVLAYVLFFSAVLIGVLIPKHRQNEPIGSLLRRLLLLVLAFIPAVHYAKVNSEYLLGSFQAIFFFVVAAIAFMNYALLHSVAGHGRTKSDSAVKAAFFTLLLISLPILRFSLRITSKVDIDFWLLSFVTITPLGLLNSNYKLRKTLDLSGMVLLVFVASGFLFKAYSSEGSYKRKILGGEYKAIVFDEKPNIYLFVYDGIPNERVFREQNLPFAGLRKILDNYGFKLYDDTYTLGEASLNSMGRMLDFTDRELKSPEGRDIYAGNSWANLILRNNGYKSRFLLDNYYTGFAAITHQDLFEEIYPPRTANTAKSDYFFVLLRGILQGEMRFNTKGLVSQEDADVQAYKLDVIMEPKLSTFIVNHYQFPSHSQNSGRCLPDENERWIARLSVALKQMEEDFQAIQVHDPSSIVIAVGDHGPILTGDCLDLAAWKIEDITPDLIWDRIGTMVAIRWPDKAKASKYDERIVTNQDVFPVVFSYLADNPDYLKYCPDNVFWGLDTPFRTKLGFDKGQILY